MGASKWDGLVCTEKWKIKNLDSKVLSVLYGKGITNTEQIIPMCGVLAWTDRLKMGMSQTDPGYWPVSLLCAPLGREGA